MSKPSPPPAGRELTEEERQRLAALREKIKQELPDLVARNQLREEARREASLTGSLRRAVYASKLPITHLARQVGIEPTILDEFLTGERNLRSDIMDRLAKAVSYDSSAVPAPVTAPSDGLDSASAADVART